MVNPRMVFLIIGIGFAIYFGASMIGSISNYFTAVEEEKVAKQEVEDTGRDLAYEYGKCVFYYRVPVEECNAAGPKGFELYEKYYGDGSWTVGADPFPET